MSSPIERQDHEIRTGLPQREALEWCLAITILALGCMRFGVERVTTWDPNRHFTRIMNSVRSNIAFALAAAIANRIVDQNSQTTLLVKGVVLRLMLIYLARSVDLLCRPTLSSLQASNSIRDSGEGAPTDESLPEMTPEERITTYIEHNDTNSLQSEIRDGGLNVDDVYNQLVTYQKPYILAELFVKKCFEPMDLVNKFIKIGAGENSFIPQFIENLDTIAREDNRQCKALFSILKKNDGSLMYSVCALAAKTSNKKVIEMLVKNGFDRARALNKAIEQLEPSIFKVLYDESSPSSKGNCMRQFEKTALNIFIQKIKEFKQTPNRNNFFETTLARLAEFEMMLFTVTGERAFGPDFDANPQKESAEERGAETPNEGSFDASEKQDKANNLTPENIINIAKDRGFDDPQIGILISLYNELEELVRELSVARAAELFALFESMLDASVSPHALFVPNDSQEASSPSPLVPPLSGARKILLEKEQNIVNRLDEDGLSPFHRAILYGGDKRIGKLIKAGADFFVLTKDGRSPFELICDRCPHELIKLNHGLLGIEFARVLCESIGTDGLNEYHRTILDATFKPYASFDLTLRKLDTIFNLTRTRGFVQTAMGRTPLELIVMQYPRFIGSPEALKAFYNLLSKAIEKQREGYEDLASDRGLLQWLNDFEYLREVNKKYPRFLGGSSVLHLFAVAGGYNQVRDLCDENSPDINLPNAYEMTPIEMAIRENHHAVALLLKRKGADLNRVSALSGRTLKYELQHLLEKIDELGVRGLAPLHEAIKKRNMEMVFELLKGGADPNVKTADGVPAVHFLYQCAGYDEETDRRAIADVLNKAMRKSAAPPKGTNPAVVRVQNDPFDEFITALKDGRPDVAIRLLEREFGIRS